ncbi:hypothetical protein I603_1340 [Erythrobacter dokdonensis DSW-74]|uniref:Uncharacterized protein n=1 Tax=Erythrobacter dokdonensis DSW-74 TaxID=1300349 RepID=A0A1A7BHM4_9SPHN|nr:hypothetical protein I603_1340 [Erythrobacter dokdonensis DSW-74]
MGLQEACQFARKEGGAMGPARDAASACRQSGKTLPKIPSLSGEWPRRSV